jgi:hypothetical protein
MVQKENLKNFAMPKVYPLKVILVVSLVFAPVLVGCNKLSTKSNSSPLSANASATTEARVVEVKVSELKQATCTAPKRLDKDAEIGWDGEAYTVKEVSPGQWKTDKDDTVYILADLGDRGRDQFSVYLQPKNDKLTVLQLDLYTKECKWMFGSAQGAQNPAMAPASIVYSLKNPG